ncbi:Histone deacetylase [Thalictrum thalictroides]|uniref:histone deacetylase n=1 Tax=Thalictrum thalictroides TaxID=46969 RepID=A0A7J6WXJ8_THATH|nr:Histone deacetylase [Thalictrum thalictroides]
MISSPLRDDMKTEVCSLNSEMLQTTHLKSGEDAHISLKQNASYSNGSHQILAPNGIDDVLCDENNCGTHICSLPVISDAADDVTREMEPDTIPVTKKLKQQKEMTFQDIYREEYDDDDDDFEDSDWEPSQEDPKKWFCTNCTMVNLDDVVHCDICGEYKDSEILRLGFFASDVAQEADHAELKLEVRDGYKDSYMWKSEVNNRTAVGYDERMLLHSEVEMKSQPHPERPDRLRAIMASLSVAGIFPGRCIPISGREITKEELETVHPMEHIEAVELTSSMVSSYFTSDTYANEHSACAARLAAGLCADLSTAIMEGNAKNGFALVRPPGHHAGVKQVMGFCLHNNAAVAALAAQRANAKKVLIVDWDVHHGNGTQEIFEANKSVLYISLHRHEDGRFYPGTGAADEVGRMGAKGYCVNIPWKCGGVGDSDYLFAFQQIVLPIASEFAPDLTIISAGFDAARGDPLGCCDVTPAGFARMTHLLTALSNGRLLVILEGGYNLRSISSSATAVIKVLLGETPKFESDSVVPTKAGLQTVMEVLQIQMKFWPKLESSLARLQSEWPSFSFQNRKIVHKRVKKKGRLLSPVWWRWGRKRLLYDLLYGRLGSKAKRCARRWP